MRSLWFFGSCFAFRSSSYKRLKRGRHRVAVQTGCIKYQGLLTGRQKAEGQQSRKAPEIHAVAFQFSQRLSRHLSLALSLFSRISSRSHPSTHSDAVASFLSLLSAAIIKCQRFAYSDQILVLWKGPSLCPSLYLCLTVDVAVQLSAYVPVRKYTTSGQLYTSMSRSACVASLIPMLDLLIYFRSYLFVLKLRSICRFLYTSVSRSLNTATHAFIINSTYHLIHLNLQRTCGVPMIIYCNGAVFALPFAGCPPKFVVCLPIDLNFLGHNVLLSYGSSAYISVDHS